MALLSHLGIGIRHLMPIYPFLYVLCGILGARFFAAAAAAAVSCLVVFAPFNPMWGRHLSYFNELAGGPTRGWKILSDSNVDWGQDLPRLRGRFHAGGASQKIDLPGLRDRRSRLLRHPIRGRGRGRSDRSSRLSRDERLALQQRFGDRSKEWQELTRNLGAREVGRARYSILIFEIK